MAYKRQNTPKRKQSDTVRYARIAGLVLLGVVIVVTLFSAGGRFDFNPRGKGQQGSFVQKIVFPGPIKPENVGLAASDFGPLDQLLAAEGRHYKQASIHIEKQDSYAELDNNAQLRFWIVLTMNDGKRIKSVITRATGRNLVDRVTWRLKEDLEQYRDVKERYGKDGNIESFTNTM